MGPSDYYERSGDTNEDGTLVFATERDRRNEKVIAAEIESKWNCEVHHFGRLCPVDFYVTRHGRIIGVMECKTRTHPSFRYPTVFFNVRKWLALNMASIGMGVPAVMVFKFTDQTMWTPVSRANGNVDLGGCSVRVKSDSDREPVFHIPISSLKQL